MVVQATLMLLNSSFVMLSAGVPVSAGIGIVSIITTTMSGMDGNTFALTATRRCFSGCDSFSLLALPFFSLGDNITSKGGTVRRLIRLARLLVERVPGCLAAINVLANMFFGAVSGSSVAATSAMDFIMSPLELNEGYDPNYSAAVDICSAPTGIPISPSGPLVPCSITTGGVSAAALFMGGYLTGAPLDITVAGLIIFLAMRRGYKVSVVKEEDPTWKIALEVVPSLLVVIIIMGGISTGALTATGASVVMYLYCTLLATIYCEISIRTSYDLLVDTVKNSATILSLIVASSIMSYVISYSGISAATSEGLTSVSDNRYMIILIMNVFLPVIGMFLDLTPAVLIFIPIFLPTTTSVGMSPVHFELMLIMNPGIDSVAPPASSCLLVGCGVGRVKTEGVAKYIVPIFTAVVISLFLVSFIPAIPLLVPYLCGLVPGMQW